MNIEQDTLDARLRYQLRVNGLADMRRQALKGLKLKTVIKESHCSQVQQLAFNMCDADCRNLFATVAKDQATVYDDLHMADHIAVVANMSLSGSAENPKDAFQSCCWINSSGLSRHPYGDALLAVAGSAPFIHIVSVVEAAVVAQLPLPPGTAVVDLSAAAEHPGLLCVLCKDGSLQLWQVATGVCYLSIKTDAFTAVLHPRGDYIVTSSRTGKLSKWDMQQLMAAAAAQPGSCNADAAAAPDAAVAAAAAAVVKEPLLASPGQEGSVVDCMRFLAGDRLATKTADGRMALHHMPSGKIISSWRVPGCSNSTASYSSRCSFGHTQDGQYVCVGNHNTTAYVFDTSTGCQVARVEAIRVQGSVRACGVSEDCRHLVMVVGSGYIFRFEYRPAAEGENDDEVEQEDGSEVDGEGEDVEMEQGAQQQQQQQMLPPPNNTLSPGVSLRQQQDMSQGLSLAQGLASQPGNPTSTPGLSADTAVLVHNPHATAAAAADQLWGGEGSQGPLGAAGWQGGSQGGERGSLSGMLGLGGSQGGGESSLPPSAGLGGSQQQHKRQRLSHGGVPEADDSPLVFRPTPTK